MIYKEYIFLAGIVIVIALVVVGTLPEAMARQDRVICLSLARQAETHKDAGFYITSREAERCADFNINAPVK